MAQLATRRAEVDLAPDAEAIAGCASALTSYANLDVFVKESAEDGTELPEDTLGLALNGKEDVAEETDSSSEGDGSEPPADEEDGASPTEPEPTASTAGPDQPGA